MKSILKSIALLSAAVLVASCDSSSGGGSAVVTPPAPQTSAAGSGTKGIMIGSTVVITDAAGAELGRSTTAADGTYDIALDNSTQGGTITGPLTVTITGGQTICDFDNPDNSGNDCPTGDPAPNDFVVFGATYDLPADFSLRSQIATPGTGSVSHATPLSELAVLKAIEVAGGTTPPTAAQVTQSLLAISGFVEAITGISLGGVDITQFQPVDLASNGAASASPIALAISGLSSSIIGAQGANESLAATIARLAALISIDANGNLTGTGTNLGILTAAFARGLNVAAQRSGNANLAQAATNAANLANVYTALGNATVTVPPLSVPGDTTAGAATKAFVTQLAQVVGDVTAATGAQGAGADGSIGSTEAFAAELDAVARASSANATIALNKLSDAVIAASQEVTATTPVTNDATSEDGLTFTLEVDADGAFTLSNVSSTWPLMSDANKVTITVSDDTANTASAGTDGGEATSFSLTGVTMVTLNAAGTSTAQTFTGSITNTYDATAATDTIAFDGTIATASTGTGSTLAVDIDLADVTRVNPRTGTYTAVFTFDAEGTANDLTLTLSGTIGASLQSYTILSAAGVGINGTVTRSGTTDVNTLSNGSATLTLTVTDGTVVADADGIIGTFTEGTGDAAVQTATLNNQGVVNFNDGSFLLLPSIIFIPDN